MHRLGLFCFTAAVAWGQAPAFDVVSVRVGEPLPAGTAQVMLDDGPAVIQLNPGGVSHILAQPFAAGGTVTLRYYTMRLLITAAYQEVIRDEYLTAGPGWMDSDHFDVIAKTAPGTPRDTERLMLQKALADRFHLAVHRERKPMPVFALTVSKRGSKLQPAKGPGGGSCQRGEEHQECRGMTMADLAKELPDLAPRYVDRPVFDSTGLGGAFDFRLDARPRAQEPEQRTTIFDALDLLGLKLEERKEPRTVIVIDHVDRVPEAN
jgi:uncharacterized protein (TIGR03435 family)